MGEANTLLGLGNLFLAAGESGRAFETLRKALEINTGIHNGLGEGAAYGYMGRAALRAGQPTRAVVLSGWAWQILRGLGDSLGQSLALKNISIGCDQLVDSKASSIAFRLACHHASEIGEGWAQELRQKNAEDPPPPDMIPTLERQLERRLLELEDALKKEGVDPLSPLL
jgi:hypothetical protein